MPPLFRPKNKLSDDYHITGFISSGTYGRVFKAVKLKEDSTTVAIKRFKPDKEGTTAYSGISQSATREMMLCASLRHPNLITHLETHLEDKSISMVFNYAEHDLLQMLHHHTSLNATAATHHSTHVSTPPSRTPIPTETLRSILYQLLSGLHYLHSNWVLHRDLKPANIMVTSSGRVQIGDLGLARCFHEPPSSLFAGDKVVVTIWYRAPELLLGGRHYTPAVDLWAVGCIIGELLGLRPMFKGEEVKPDASSMSSRKGGVPFQRSQMGKIVEILGLPMTKDWPLLPKYPDAGYLPDLLKGQQAAQFRHLTLEGWYRKVVWSAGYTQPDNWQQEPRATPGLDLLDLMGKMLTWNPDRRITAEATLNHEFFTGQARGGVPSDNCFEGCELQYPKRKVGPDGLQQTALGAATARGTLKRTYTGDEESHSKRMRPG